jgi:hypothetical protein
MPLCPARSQCHYGYETRMYLLDKCRKWGRILSRDKNNDVP